MSLDPPTNLQNERGGEQVSTDFQNQQDELMALESIYSDRADQFRYEMVGEGDGRTVKGSINIHLPKLNNPVFLISTGLKDVEVNYLMPITLEFEFPADYPSYSHPDFKLSSLWISSETAERLSSRLIESWNEYQGMPILFTWVQLLEEEALSDLPTDRKINLDNVVGKESQAAECISMKSDERLKILKEYNEQAAQEAFEKEWYECEVCFDTKSGKNSVKFIPCGHIFCLDCVSSFFRQQLKDLTVKRLECLTEDCESIATQAQLKRALGAEEYERYENLLLQGTLDLMSDVVSCPRSTCGAPVLLDSDREESTSGTSNLARCSICQYTFCVLCKKTYHGVNPCSIDPNMRDKLLSQYENATQAEREVMYKRFGGRRQLEKQLDFMRTSQWIDANSKPCPKCRTAIEKKDGCNKMRCTKCGGNFCWLCGQVLSRLDPYNHFNVAGASACYNRLFEGIELSDDEAAEEDDEAIWLDVAGLEAFEVSSDDSDTEGPAEEARRRPAGVRGNRRHRGRH